MRIYNLYICALSNNIYKTDTVEMIFTLEEESHICGTS